MYIGGDTEGDIVFEWNENIMPAKFTNMETRQIVDLMVVSSINMLYLIME